MKKIFLILLFATSAFAVLTHWHVNPNIVGGAGDGTSAANAFPGLKAAENAGTMGTGDTALCFQGGLPRDSMSTPCSLKVAGSASGHHVIKGVAADYLTDSTYFIAAKGTANACIFGNDMTYVHLKNIDMTGGASFVYQFLGDYLLMENVVCRNGAGVGFGRSATGLRICLLYHCASISNATNGINLLSTGGALIYDCTVSGSGADGISISSANTVSNCILYNNYRDHVTSSGNYSFVLNNTMNRSKTGSGMKYAASTEETHCVNNLFTAMYRYGIERATAIRVDNTSVNNAFYACSLGNYLNMPPAINDQTLSSYPYVDTSVGDYRFKTTVTRRWLDTLDFYAANKYNISARTPGALVSTDSACPSCPSLPKQHDVRKSITYAGTDSTGTVYVPSRGNTRYNVLTDTGGLKGTAYIPSRGNTRYNIAVDSAGLKGTAYIPALYDVRYGINADSTGTGTIRVPRYTSVRYGVAVDTGLTGTARIPGAAYVLKDTLVDSAGGVGTYVPSGGGPCPGSTPFRNGAYR